MTAKPATQGVHSAVLRIDDEDVRGLERATLLVVEAAASLTAGTAWSTEGAADRNEAVRYTPAVPAGTKSLTVNLSGLADGSQTRFWVYTPEGVSGERAASGSLNCYSDFSDPAVCAPGARTFANPKAGVWEIVVESRRTSPLPHNPFHLEASVTS